MKVKKNLIVNLIVTVLIVTGLIWLGSKSQCQRKPMNEEVFHVEQDVPDGWESLFDGKTLEGWEIVRYGNEGEPYVKDGVMVLPMSYSGLTGVCWVGDSLPVNNYIIYYEARRVAGYDIFAGLSFPYGETFASLILGGWGGIINGLSSINGQDASENETTKRFFLDDNEWHPIQVQVTTDSIRAFAGTEQVVDLATAGKKIHLRPGSYTTNLTLWTYQTTGEIRNLRIKKVTTARLLSEAMH